MNATDNQPKGKKMQVKIIETGELMNLAAIDDATGTEWTADLIGNHGAFNANQFHRELDEDGEEIDEYWVCSQAEYEWWDAVVSDLNKADSLKQEAKAAGLWSEEVESEYQEIGHNDLDAQAAECRQFMEELLASD